LANPAARLTVVVVLPTPPFWLAMQKILAMCGSGGSASDRELDAESDQEKVPASFSSVVEMRGLARMRSARKCVSSVEVRPYRKVSAAMVPPSRRK
jgi:hypothetical protein